MKNLFLQSIFGLLLITLPARSYAFYKAGLDSITPVIAFVEKADTGADFARYLSAIADNRFESDDALHELVEIENTWLNKTAGSRSLVRLLKLMRVKKIMRHPKNRQRLLLDMAGVSAQLRLYPFAMKCYYQSISSTDSTTDGNMSFIQHSMVPDTALTVDAGNLLNDQRERKSYPLKPGDIEQSFDDGKDIAVCAVLLHVKQPSPGKRKAFVGLNNVGHTFITLIKYNTDSSVVSRSFGFYPHKNGLLTGTPFHPAALSVIKDDAFHTWDQVAGKFISYRRFRRILRMLDKLEGKQYDLNKNNCTDFALYAAVIGGIDVQDTKGRWPFGRGNNPANAGQSLLEKKIVNADTGNTDGLFLWNSRVTAERIVK